MSETPKKSGLPFDPDDPEAFFPEAQKRRDKAAFQDFLVAPNISGSERTVIHRALIPAEVVLDTGRVLEITYEDEEEEGQPEHDTIVVRRREDQTIESIEIRCSCGKKFIVQFSDESPPAPEESEAAGRSQEASSGAEENAPDAPVAESEASVSTQSVSSSESPPAQR